jgi:hypothetical protein
MQRKQQEWQERHEQQERQHHTGAKSIFGAAIRKSEGFLTLPYTVITVRETQTLGKNTVNDLHHHLSLHIVDAAAGYSGTTSKSLMREAQLSSCNKRTADGRDRQLDRQIGVTVILWRVCISPWKPKSLEYIPDWSYSRQSRTSNITYVK